MPSRVRGEPTSTGTGMSRPRPFAASSAADGVGVEGVGAQAVHRVGRQHDELAAATVVVAIRPSRAPTDAHVIAPDPAHVASCLSRPRALSSKSILFKVDHALVGQSRGSTTPSRSCSYQSVNPARQPVRSSAPSQLEPRSRPTVGRLRRRWPLPVPTSHVDLEGAWARVEARVASGSGRGRRGPDGRDVDQRPGRETGADCPAGRRARRPRAAGRSRRAATPDDADRIQPVGAGPQRHRGVVARQPPGRGSPRPAGCTAGWLTTTCDRAVQLARRRRHVAQPQVDGRPGAVAGRPRVAPCVGLDGVHLAPAAPRWPRRSAIAPDPVHRSTTTGGRLRRHGSAARWPPRRRLRLRSRHEDARTDRELEVPEAGHAGDVLQRLPGGPPVDVRRKGPQPPAPATDGPEAPAVHAQRVRGQLLGVVPGDGTPAAVSRAAPRVDGGGAADGSSLARGGDLAAVSASTRACTTASRSPSSTGRGCRP